MNHRPEPGGGMPDLLRGAIEHAALGERVPAMTRVPSPVRWLARLTAGGLFTVAGPLTRRQREVNRSLLAACQHLDGRLAGWERRAGELAAREAELAQRQVELAQRQAAIAARQAEREADEAERHAATVARWAAEKARWEEEGRRRQAEADRRRAEEAEQAARRAAEEAEREARRAAEEAARATSPVKGLPRDALGDTGPRTFLAMNNPYSLMLWAERVVLYGTVYGLRPKRILEIGTYRGGSARIIAAALDDVGGPAQMVCVDPEPKIPEENWEAIRHRATVVAEPSPQALDTARRAIGGTFDFALIDGNHSYENVVTDTEGAMGVLDPGSFILFHDAHYQPVRESLADLFVKHAGRLVDVGMMSTPRLVEANGTCWGGLRLARYDGESAVTVAVPAEPPAAADLTPPIGAVAAETVAEPLPAADFDVAVADDLPAADDAAPADAEEPVAVFNDDPTPAVEPADADADDEPEAPAEGQWTATLAADPPAVAEPAEPAAADLDNEPEVTAEGEKEAERAGDGQPTAAGEEPPPEPKKGDGAVG